MFISEQVRRYLDDYKDEEDDQRDAAHLEDLLVYRSLNRHSEHQVWLTLISLDAGDRSIHGRIYFH